MSKFFNTEGPMNREKHYSLLFGEVTKEETQRFLRELSADDRLFPDGKRRKPALASSPTSSARRGSAG